jgi:hypothetical protein
MDYLMWRGDLSFKNSPMNELDKIIFARMSYLPFSEIKFEEKNSIKDLSKKFNKVKKEKFLWPGDDKFIELLGETNRFKNFEVTDYVEIIDFSAEKQYSSITIHISDKEKYISFRGTDASIVGWKEDFNMSFSYNIPSQLEAVEYINKIGVKYPDSSFILGGHSKGGNVAVYAGIYADSNVKPRIKEIINADGPGFSSNVIEDKKYIEIAPKIKTYIPQTSIVGRLLEHEEEYLVVKSTQKGILQHDIYSWEVGPTFLIQLKEVTKESQIMNNFTKEWLSTTTPEEREKFINIIYDILEKSNVKQTSEIPKVLLKNTKLVLNNFQNIDKEDRKRIENMILQMVSLMKNAIIYTK